MTHAQLEELFRGLGELQGKRMREVEARLTAAEARTASAEARADEALAAAKTAGFVDRGVWKSTDRYGAGEWVTYDGSLWIAQRDTIGSRPNAGDGAWRLRVKRGRDGKDARF